jgi:hypothetical protein
MYRMDDCLIKYMYLIQSMWGNKCLKAKQLYLLQEEEEEEEEEGTRQRQIWWW